MSLAARQALTGLNRLNATIRRLVNGSEVNIAHILKVMPTDRMSLDIPRPLTTFRSLVLTLGRPRTYYDVQCVVRLFPEV